MKALKQINIKIKASLNDKDEIVASEIEDNLTEIKNEIEYYFDHKYVPATVVDNIAKTRYNKSVGKLSSLLLKELLMSIFTLECEKQLEQTKAELKSTNSELKETKAKLSQTESRLNELERVLKVNGLI